MQKTSKHPVTKHQAGYKEQKPREDGDPETRGISGALIPTSLPSHGPALLGTVVLIHYSPPPPPFPLAPASASLLERCQNNLASLRVRLHFGANLLFGDDLCQC